MSVRAREQFGRGATGGRWRARSGLATLLRISVWLVPLVTSVAVAVVAATLLPPALSLTGQVLWWAAVLGSSGLALLATDRLLRRTLPLAALLDVSLAFPHSPPSRFAVLRQVRSLEELRARIRDGDGDGAQAAVDLLALVVALDEHDRATRGHSERVRLYAELLGEELDLDDGELDRLRWAALVHDVGKLSVPAEVLNKDDELQEDEWARLRRHPSEGARLVAPLREWLGPWTGAIEQHHERVDGTGYPRGLEGTQIALGGRIVAVVDAFETMTAARPYKRPLTVAAARRELVASAGTHFDEGIVRAFLNLSVPRLRHIAGWSAWVAAIPGLWALRRLPRATGNTVMTAAGVGILAATGVLAPAPEPPGSGPPTVVAAPDPRADVPSPDGEDPTGAERATPPAGTSDATTVDVTDPDGPGDGGAPPGGSPTGGDRPDDGGSTDDGTTDGDADDDTGDGSTPDGPRETHQIGHDGSTVLRDLYLHSSPTDTTLRHEVLPLDGSEPRRAELVNYDADVDDTAGLLLRPSDRGRDETRPDHRQRWAVDLGAPTTLAGSMSLTVWVTAATPGTSNVALGAYVDHCDHTFGDCRPVSEGTGATPVTHGTWQELIVEVPLGSALMVDERLLVLTLVAGPGSDGDVSVAFDTTDHPAVLGTSVGVIASPALPATAAAVHDGRGLQPVSSR